MSLSLERYKAAALEAGLAPEQDSMIQNQTTAWRQTSETKATRISLNSRSEVTRDMDVSWAQGFEQECERIKRSMWQRMRGAGLDDVIYGPNKEEYACAKGRKHVYLLWGNMSGVDVEKEAKQRIVKNGLEMLGQSLAIIRNATPQPLEAKFSYYPNEDPALSVEEAYQGFTAGVERVFAQLYKSKGLAEDPGVRILWELEDYWRKNVGFATIVEIEGKEMMAPLHDSDFKRAMVMILPPHHKGFPRREPFFAKGLEENDLLFVKPVRCTPALYGAAGIHELTHVYDFAKGTLPRGNPTPEQEADAEVRAYLASVRAADMSTEGAFSTVINEYIDHKHLTLEDMITAQTSTSPFTVNLMQTIDEHLRLEPPVSQSDFGVRATIYNISTAFAIAERMSSNQEELDRLRKKVIKIVYELPVEPGEGIQ